LWPLFGISNQMLAAIALCVATAILVKSGKVRFVWVTAVPLVWLVLVTSTAAWEKLFSSDLRVGLLAHANDLAERLASGVLPTAEAARAPQLIFNDHLNASLSAFFLGVTWIMVLDTLRVSFRALTRRRTLPLTEAPHIPSRLVEDWVRD
jgi:carbon starvation protein